MTTIPDLSPHAYAIDVSGYTRIPAQLDAHELALLRAESDRALAAVEAATKRGESLAATGGTDYYRACRSLYCWGEASQRLLDNETIHALATLLMGQYILWDMSVMSALPVPPEAKGTTTSWHRDFAGLHQGTQVPGYLWFFICLDNVTPDNGATWVVPGSHRLGSKHESGPSAPWSGDQFEAYPSRIQLCAEAGDLLVFSPSLLHTSGRNRTTNPRRLLNVGLCHADLQPLLDHWSIAGPKLQPQLGPRAKKLLGAGRKPLETTWSVLPAGWSAAG